MEELTFETREDFRNWLKINHKTTEAQKHHHYRKN
jgi:hypothetical protein